MVKCMVLAPQRESYLFQHLRALHSNVAPANSVLRDYVYSAQWPDIYNSNPLSAVISPESQPAI